MFSTGALARTIEEAMAQRHYPDSYRKSIGPFHYIRPAPGNPGEGLGPPAQLMIPRDQTVLPGGLWIGFPENPCMRSGMQQFLFRNALGDLPPPPPVGTGVLAVGSVIPQEPGIQGIKTIVLHLPCEALGKLRLRARLFLPRLRADLQRSSGPRGTRTQSGFSRIF